MKEQQANQRELLMEVRKDGCSRRIFRTRTADGSVILLEESDLLDFSQTLSGEGDFNVYFSLRACWGAFVRFTGIEGWTKRQMWHEPSKDWLLLEPVFIHDDLKRLVKESLAQMTRELGLEDREQIEGLRVWLRRLSQSDADLDCGIFHPAKAYRHAV